MAIVNITQENFESVAMQADKILLDFWAPWCGPCRLIAPHIDDIAAEDESLTVGKVNVDEEMALAAKFGITSIPTLIVLEKGQVKNQALGYRTKADILKLL